jgi:hypothetical protein
MWTRPTAMRASSNTQKLQFPGFNWKHYFKTFFTKYDFIFWNIWFYILEYLVLYFGIFRFYVLEFGFYVLKYLGFMFWKYMFYILWNRQKTVC